MNNIAARLETKSSSKVYADASKAALRLSRNLEVAGEIFFTNPDVESFKTFKASCKNIFASNEAGALKEHRGIWYQIHPILRGILGLLAALTIIPAFIVVVTATHGYVDTFFTTPKTTSGHEVCKLALKQAEIEVEIVKLSRSFY